MAADGDAVRIERVAGTFTPLISGGQAIYSGGSLCSLGFELMRADAVNVAPAYVLTGAGLRKLP